MKARAGGKLPLPPGSQTNYRFNPAANSICDKARTNSPRKVLKSSPGAHHLYPNLTKVVKQKFPRATINTL
jgi:hypothetical protein